MFNKEKIIDRYDELAYEAREGGVSYRELIVFMEDEFATEYAGTSVSGLDVPELIYDSIRFHVQTARGTRRQSLKDLFDCLGDKLDNPKGSKEYTRADARLRSHFGRAYPLGAEDGRDKVLGLWTVDDVKNSVKSRRENLKKQKIAVQQFENAAGRAVQAIKQGVSWA